MTFDIGWGFWTGDEVDSDGDRAGTDEDVRHHYYEGGAWKKGFVTDGGPGSAFESDTYTGTSFDNSSYDISRADTLALSLSPQGTHNPSWYCVRVAFIVDDDLDKLKVAQVNDWIRLGERKEFRIDDASEDVRNEFIALMKKRHESKEPQPKTSLEGEH